MDGSLNSNKLKKVIILGRTGFIGSALESYLQKKGDIEVMAEAIPSVDLTIKEEVIGLEDYFDSETVVIMCSAIKRNRSDDIDTFMKNVMMVVNLCELLEKKPVGRFIYFSSTAVYGEANHNLNISENTAIEPTSYYGIAKFTSETLLKKTSLSIGENALVILRPPLVYGPGDQPCYGPSGFVRAALNNDLITLWGDGTERREFLFIEDIVKITNDIIFNSFIGTLNLAPGENYSYVDILNFISSLLDTEVKLAGKDRTDPKVDHSYQNDKFRKLFPEMSFTPLRIGVQKTIEKLKS